MTSNTVVEISQSRSVKQTEDDTPSVVKKSWWQCGCCIKKKHAHKLTKWEIDYVIHERTKSAFNGDKKPDG